MPVTAMSWIVFALRVAAKPHSALALSRALFLRLRSRRPVMTICLDFALTSQPMATQQRPLATVPQDDSDGHDGVGAGLLHARGVRGGRGAAHDAGAPGDRTHLAVADFRGDDQVGRGRKPSPGDPFVPAYYHHFRNASISSPRATACPRATRCRCYR
ncbi:unnamed protein product [Ectocarpus sp. 8 AP-2014]